MKRTSGFIFLSILLSCSNAPETANQPVSNSINSTDTIDTSSHISISEQINPTLPIEVADLQGKTFVLGGGIDENVCEITEACDCCNADLMFITGNQFVYDDLCEGHYVRKGKYKLEGNLITLEFEPQLVSFYHNDESETNPEAPESVLKSEIKAIANETFTLGKCKEFTIITNNKKSEDVDLPVGILKEASVMDEKVSMLKQIGIWKMLSLR